MKNKSIFFLISTLIAVIAMGLYITKNAHSFKEIFQVSILNIIIFTLLQIALLAVNASVLLIYMDVFKNKISFFDSFGLSSVNAFFNNILAKGGAFVRGYYLKKAHSLLFTDFILTLASFTLIEFMVSGFIGIILLLVIYFEKGCLNPYLFLFFILILSACCIIIKFPFHKILKRKNIWVIRKLSDVAISWQRIASDMKIMSKLFILAILNFVIFALRLQYAFRILYKSASFTDCLLISTTGTLGNLLAITPGALGIREFLIGTTYKLINGTMIHAVVVTVLDRAISTIVVFILGGFFILYFMRKTKNAIT